MVSILYDWLKKIAFYSVLITAVIQMMPESSYQKYVKFITGLIFVIILSEPLLSLFSMKESFYELYHGQHYLLESREIEAADAWMEEMVDESNESQMDP